MSFPWATLVQAGVQAGGQLAGGAVGGILGNWANKKAAARSYEYQKRAMIEGPSHYLEGMEKAGLNPLAMSGQLPSKVGSTGQTNAVSDPAAAAMQGAQLALINAQARKTGAEANLIVGTTPPKVSLAQTQAAAAAAVHNAKEREWRIKVPLLKKDGTIYHTLDWKMNEYNAQSYKAIMEMSISRFNQEQKGMYNEYYRAVFEEVQKDKSLNPVLIEALTMAITLGIMEKEKAWFVPKALGSMLGSGAGAAVIKGATGGF